MKGKNEKSQNDPQKEIGNAEDALYNSTYDYVTMLMKHGVHRSIFTEEMREIFEGAIKDAYHKEPKKTRKGNYSIIKFG